ncbi:putative thyrotropin-releasing hormone-degrading ectoenzyme, partial [Scophthalmus maximus]
ERRKIDIQLFFLASLLRNKRLMNLVAVEVMMKNMYREKHNNQTGTRNTAPRSSCVRTLGSRPPEDQVNVGVALVRSTERFLCPSPACPLSYRCIFSSFAPLHLLQPRSADARQLRHWHAMNPGKRRPEDDHTGGMEGSNLKEPSTRQQRLISASFTWPWSKMEEEEEMSEGEEERRMEGGRKEEEEVGGRRKRRMEGGKEEEEKRIKKRRGGEEVEEEERRRRRGVKQLLLDTVSDSPSVCVCDCRPLSQPSTRGSIWFITTICTRCLYFQEKQRFLTDVLHEVMLLDGLSSSHPISQEVEQATDINRVFDWIAYKKGAALIRMLANVMGQPLFQKGLNDYLLSHMYSNAARDDLWSKLSQAMRSEGRDINIGEMMDRWTLQMGYPVVTISKNQSEQLPTHYITVSQEHFLYAQEVRGNNSLQWQVPLTVAVGNESALSAERLIWINNKTETHRVGQMDDSTWLLGNINQTGYFRVNYDLQNWKLLIQQLHTSPQIISVGNRAGLIDDAFNLARAGYLPQGIPLQLIGYLPEETSFLPWHAASRALYQLDKLLDRTEEYSLFSDYVLKQVASRYHQMGWPTNGPGNEGNILQASYQTEELQRELIMLACSFGNKQCHRQAVAYISDWISSNKNRIPPNIRDIVYCTGVSLMDEDVWEFIWMKFHSTGAISEKKILLEALTCSDNTFLLNRLLNLSLSSDLVPEQDVIDVIIHVGRNPQGRSLAWRYFREKWDVLNARYGEALFMNSKLISGVTEFLNTERELNETCGRLAFEIPVREFISECSKTLRLLQDFDCDHGNGDVWTTSAVGSNSSVNLLSDINSGKCLRRVHNRQETFRENIRSEHLHVRPAPSRSSCLRDLQIIIPPFISCYFICYNKFHKTLRCFDKRMNKPDMK